MLSKYMYFKEDFDEKLLIHIAVDKRKKTEKEKGTANRHTQKNSIKRDLDREQCIISQLQLKRISWNIFRKLKT